MPIFEIQGADGKTYEADAADQQTALNAFKAHTQPAGNAPSAGNTPPAAQTQPAGNAPPKAAAPFSSSLGILNPFQVLGAFDAAARAGANTATLGAADHLAAWANSMTGVDKTPDAAGIAAGEKTPLEKQRGYDKTAETDHPVASTVGGLAGAFAAPETGLFKAAPLVKGITDAAFQGAASGFNNTDGTLADKAGGAAGSGTLGAAFGTAAGVASKAIPAIGSAARDMVGTISDPTGQNYALRKVGEAAQKSGQDIPSMVQGLTAARTTAPDFVAADQLGNPGGRLARTVLNNGSEGAEALRQQLVDRQMASGDRVKSIVGNTMGDPASYHGTLDDAIQGMKTKAAPFYASAEATPIDYAAHPELQDLLQRVPPSATAEANKIMGVEGKQSNQILLKQNPDGSFDKSSLPDMTQWNYIKQGMDSLINGTEGKGIASGVTPYGRALTGLKNEILPVLDTAVPDYGKARSIFKGDADVKDALETGRGALSADPEEIAKMVSGTAGPNRLIPSTPSSVDPGAMSEAEKKAYGIGMSRAIGDTVDKTKSTGDTLSNIWNSPIMKNRIQAGVGDDAKFGDLSNKLNQEGAMSRTFRKAGGNSSTAEQMQDSESALQSGLGEAITRAATRGPMNAVMNAGIQGARKLGVGMTDTRAGALASDLGSDGQDVLKRYQDAGATSDKLSAMGDFIRKYGPAAARATMVNSMNKP